MTNLQPPAGAGPPNQPPRPYQQPPPGWQAQPYGPPPPARPRRKPWISVSIILVVNALFLWWLIAGLATDTSCTGMGGSELEACQTGETIGAGVGAFLIIGLWAFVDIILAVIFGVIYMVGRRR